jgi:hypothetical protein
MHTDQTLEILDDVTVHMGAEFRAFAKKTCTSFDTKELPREADARKRRVLKKMQSQPGSQSDHGAKDLEEQLSKAAVRRPKGFSLRKYTYHSLGDYADTIRQFGTSDSFSTEPVRNRPYTMLAVLTLCRVMNNVGRARALHTKSPVQAYRSKTVSQTTGSN